MAKADQKRLLSSVRLLFANNDLKRKKKETTFIWCKQEIKMYSEAAVCELMLTNRVVVVLWPSTLEAGTLRSMCAVAGAALFRTRNNKVAKFQGQIQSCK